MNRWIIISIFVFAGILGFSLSLYIHHKNFQSGEPELVLHDPVSFVAQLKNDPKAGEKIFIQYCSSCHNDNPVIPLNAPAKGNQKAWKKYQNWSMQKLLNTADNGIKGMPARGGCFECSDELLQQAIGYLMATPASSSNHKPSPNLEKQ